MPFLFSLGQHSCVERPSDDVYVTTPPNRVGTVHNILWEKIRPPACDQLERIVQLRSGLPTIEQRFLKKVFGNDVLLSRSAFPWLRMCSRRGPSSSCIVQDARTTCCQA